VVLCFQWLFTSLLCKSKRKHPFWVFLLVCFASTHYLFWFFINCMMFHHSFVASPFVITSSFHQLLLLHCSLLLCHLLFHHFIVCYCFATCCYFIIPLFVVISSFYCLLLLCFHLLALFCHCLLLLFCCHFALSNMNWAPTPFYPLLCCFVVHFAISICYS
jgi:hypothetical protein